MNSRETSIAKKILDYLHEEEGRQVHLITIHAEIGGLPACGTAELDDVLKHLDTRKLVMGLKTKFKGVLWNITDAGEAARLEM
jgi:hypothetical protein